MGSKTKSADIKQRPASNTFFDFTPLQNNNTIRRYHSKRKLPEFLKCDKDERSANVSRQADYNSIFSKIFSEKLRKPKPKIIIDKCETARIPRLRVVGIEKVEYFFNRTKLTPWTDNPN